MWACRSSEFHQREYDSEHKNEKHRYDAQDKSFHRASPYIRQPVPVDSPEED
jgi:hypothetical protein